MKTLDQVNSRIFDARVDWKSIDRELALKNTNVLDLLRQASLIEVETEGGIVGIGEACLSPAAYSMIADLFPKAKRGVPISFYAMGIYCGAGMAFIVGGFVIELVSRAEEIVLPLIGIVHPWQMTFFIVGIPGLILVAISRGEFE